MTKKYLLALLWLQAALFPLTAQKNEHDQAFMKVETPTVASFTKFIDHPVDLYNGSPDITVPIYTLKDGVIEIPLTMRYHASGIKVSEEAGWAGLGWNLNVGGVIVQNVVGKKDKEAPFKANLNYYPTGTFTNYKQIPYRINDKNLYDSFFFYAAQGDLEPDVFLLSYPGYSGKFFIDYRTNTVHPLKKEIPIQIEKINQGWEITTETGIVHTFGSPKDTYPAGKVESVCCIYYLLESIYPNGQSITYSYTNSTLYPYQYTEGQNFAVSRPGGISISDPQPYSFATTSTANELTLSSILTDNYKVEFITSTRSDLQNGKKLDEIKISSRKNEWGVTPKRFKLTYDYFTTSTIGNYWPVSPISGFTFDMEKAKRRLKLLSIHEIIGTSTVFNKYSFDYYTPELPVKNSYAIDYWGYYNGMTSNTSTIPDFEKLLWGLEQGRLISSRQKRKANRTYHFDSCLAGMLKQVTYPTGGRSVYTYEPNEFQYSHAIPTREEANQSSTLATVVDRNSRSDIKEVSFTLTETTEVKIQVQLSRGLNAWFDMQVSGYILTRAGNVVKQETMSISSLKPTDTKVEKEVIMTLSPGTYQFSVYIPDALGDQYGSMLNHGEIKGTITKIRTISTGPASVKGAGVRIAKVDFYESAASTSKLYTVGYEYTGGVLYSYPFFHRTHTGVSYAVRRTTGLNGQYEIVLLEGIEEIEISGNSYSSTPYSMANGTVGYSKVIERITSAEGTTGHTEYNFYNSGETNTSSSVQIPNSRNGLKSSIYHYNQLGTKVSSEAFTYSTTKKHHYWGVNLIDKFNRTPGFFSGSGGTLVESDSSHPLLNLGDFSGRYVTLLYEVSSYESLLTSKETMIDGVTTKELYEYTTHGLLNKTTFTQSDGKANVTQITYPSDYNCGIWSTMQNKNMLALPVEKRNVVGGNLVAGSLTEYIARGTDIVPTTLSFATLPSSGNPSGYSCSGVATNVYPQKDVRFHNYDSRSNPIYVSAGAGATHTVYLWGYNYQYPVAKIENATYSEVKTALGNVTPESLSSEVTPNMTNINALRSKLPGALITTYTYKPLLGIDTITSPTGEKTTYQYDSAGRLYQIKDHNGKIIEQYNYNYRAQ